MFHAEYSSGQPLCLLVDLRTVVDTALAKTAAAKQNAQPSANTAKSETAKSHAASAAASATASPEFEVFGSSATAEDDNQNRD